MNTQTRNRILAAVAAVLPVMVAALPASAQTPVNNRADTGSANEANPSRSGPSYTGNQLVTGNVSGAKSFRGPVGYRDPLDFTGPTGRRGFDRYNRDSTAAPTRSNPSVNYGRATGYYGDSRATPPPAGFRADSFSGGYFNTGAAQTTVTGRNPSYQSPSSVFATTNSMLRPSGLLLDGGLDANSQPQLLSASPLYGVMPISPTMLSNSGNSLTMSATKTANPRDRFRLDPAQIDQMREELNGRAPDADNAGGTADPANQAQKVDGQAVSNAVGDVQGNQTESARAAQSASRNQVSLDPSTGNQVDNRLNAQPLETATMTQQGQGQQLNVPPERQSKQYAALQQRFQLEQAGQTVTAEQNNLNIRRLNQAQAGGEAAPDADGLAPGQPPAPGEPQAPGQPAAPGEAPAADPGQPAPQNLGVPRAPGKAAAAPAQPPAAKPDKAAEPAPAPAVEEEKPAANRPAPVRIKSLAEGVEAKGLRDLLVSAEELMKAGKFTSAVDKYVAAEQVAPNNPMIRLGRAHAELGATRYGSAEQHIREAMTSDPALLMGQYDFESFFGRDRLGFLIKDLKQMAITEGASPRPKLLLAYIAYGIPGQEAVADESLKQAAERTGRVDPLIQSMRKHWVLNPAPTASEPAAQELDVNK
jgi:hypothetical protein